MEQFRSNNTHHIALEGQSLFILFYLWTVVHVTISKYVIHYLNKITNIENNEDKIWQLKRISLIEQKLDSSSMMLPEVIRPFWSNVIHSHPGNLVRGDWASTCAQVTCFLPHSIPLSSHSYLGVFPAASELEAEPNMPRLPHTSPSVLSQYSPPW